MRYILLILITLSTTLYAQCQEDLNDDGTVNVIDIVNLVNFVLYGEECEESSPYGCTDPNACNFNPNATIFDNSCTYCYLDDCDIYPEEYYDCNGNSIFDILNSNWESYMRIANFESVADTTFYYLEEDYNVWTLNLSNNQWNGYVLRDFSESEIGWYFTITDTWHELENANYTISQDTLSLYNYSFTEDYSFYQLECSYSYENGFTRDFHYEIQNNFLTLNYMIDDDIGEPVYIEWILINIPEPNIIGCTDPNYLNYNPMANTDSGFCNNIFCERDNSYLSNDNTNPSFLNMFKPNSNPTK